jgi:hypothetical protein
MMTEHGPENHDPPPKTRSASSNTFSGTVTGTVVQAGAVVGGVHQYLPPSPAPIPRQLPPCRPSLPAGRMNWRG